jgi:hypothetical protein
MKVITLLLLPVSLLFLAGCSTAPTPPPEGPDTGHAAADKPADPPDDEAEVKAALAQLPPEDLRLAEAQQFCAVEDENRLGSMGVPVKVMAKDQPVFLCCKGCRKKALADPDKTLTKVRELKQRTAGVPVD